MTSFTAASAPLDNAMRAYEMLSDVLDALEHIEERAHRTDEDVYGAAFRAAIDLNSAHARLWDAIERLRGLENLILGRTTGELDPEAGR